MGRIVITNLLQRLRLLSKGYASHSLESCECAFVRLVGCMMKLGLHL